MARDRHNLRSEPQTITFQLRFGPATQPQAQKPVETSADSPKYSDLEVLAGLIAKTIEPKVTPAYFSAYRTAMEVPGRCRVNNAQEQNFTSTYKDAFEQLRSRLTSSNIDAFYDGLCAAWGDKLRREAAEQRRVEYEHAAALRLAEQQRDSVIAANNTAQFKHQTEVMVAWAGTYITIWVIGGALVTFLIISLIVAFLAIENHSRAVREAIERTVKMLADKQQTTTQNP